MWHFSFHQKALITKQVCQLYVNGKALIKLSHVTYACTDLHIYGKRNITDTESKTQDFLWKPLNSRNFEYWWIYSTNVDMCPNSRQTYSSWWIGTESDNLWWYCHWFPWDLWYREQITQNLQIEHLNAFFDISITLVKAALC